MNYIALCDGWCENNGQSSAMAGGSYLIYQVDSPVVPDLTQMTNPLHQEIRFSFTGITTNNVAEAETLFILLTELKNRGYLTPENYIIIFMDSRLTIDQVKGLSRVKNPKLIGVHQRIQKIIKDYEETHRDKFWRSVRLRHISGDTMKQTEIGH